MNTSLPTVRSTTQTIATLTLTHEIEVRDMGEYAGHDRSVRVPAGTYEVKASIDWRSPYVYIAFAGSLVRNTWNGRPTGGEKPGDVAEVKSHVYIYSVCRAAAGKDTGALYGGKVTIADGWSIDPVDDGALVAPTGELIALSTSIRADEVAAYRERIAAHLAKQAS